MRYQVATNFNKELLKKEFECMLESTNKNWDDIVESLTDMIQIEVFAVKRFDKLHNEFIFENLDSGLTYPECTLDNQNIAKLFQDYEELKKPGNEFIEIVRGISSEHTVQNLKRIFDEQIKIAKQDPKPDWWNVDKKAKFKVKNDSDWIKFIKRLINISHEATWLVHSKENDKMDMIDINQSGLNTTYYYDLNWNDITFEAQTRAFRRLA